MSLKDLKKRVARLQRETKARENCEVIFYDATPAGRAELEKRLEASTAPVRFCIPHNHRN